MYLWYSQILVSYPLNYCDTYHRWEYIVQEQYEKDEQKNVNPGNAKKRKGSVDNRFKNIGNILLRVIMLSQIEKNNNDSSKEEEL